METSTAPRRSSGRGIVFPLFCVSLFVAVADFVQQLARSWVQARGWLLLSIECLWVGLLPVLIIKAAVRAARAAGSKRESNNAATVRAN